MENFKIEFYETLIILSSNRNKILKARKVHNSPSVNIFLCKATVINNLYLSAILEVKQKLISH